MFQGITANIHLKTGLLLSLAPAKYREVELVQLDGFSENYQAKSK